MTATDAGRVAGFFHAGLTVRSLERSLAFYRDGLGLEVQSSSTRTGDALEPIRQVIGADADAVTVAFLRIPGSDALVELFEYAGIEQHPASARPWDIAAGHFCLFVDDAAAVCERLAALGFATRNALVTIASGPHVGARAAYAIDPDGYHVELYQRAPAR